MLKKYPVATIVGLSVALLVPFVFDLILNRSVSDLANQNKMLLFITVEWVIALILLGIVLIWEKKTLSSIGIKKMSLGDFVWAVIAFFIGAISFILTIPLVNALGLETTSGSILQLTEIPIPLRLGIVITAAITEEIQFRGYPIERLRDLTGSLFWGAAISYIIFVLLHIPFWGIGGTIQIGIWNIVVTLLYIKRRNLFSCMLMHFLNDAYAFILLPMISKQYLK